MKQPNTFLKVITISGFILLMGTFVAFKSGAFEKYDRSNLDSPGKDSMRIELDRTVIPSTKSAPVYRPQQSTTPATQQKNNNAAPPVNQSVTPPQNNSAQPNSSVNQSAPATQQKPSGKNRKKRKNKPTMMPSSKSAMLPN